MTAQKKEEGERDDTDSASVELNNERTEFPGECCWRLAIYA